MNVRMEAMIFWKVELQSACDAEAAAFLAWERERRRPTPKSVEACARREKRLAQRRVAYNRALAYRDLVLLTVRGLSYVLGDRIYVRES